QRHLVWCRQPLTAGREDRFELIDGVVRKRHAHDMLGHGFDAERDEAARARPALAQSAVFLESHIAEAKRPAYAEIAAALVLAIVGSRDLERKTGQRHRHIEERDAEPSHLLVAVDDRCG